MQTLKTAAIVVLMMTVMYGAYVSMTTPPDPLPQGVKSLLVESGMDDFPNDFGDFGIDTGIAEDISNAGNQLSDVASDMNLNEQAMLEDAGDSMGFAAVDQTFGDASPSGDIDSFDDVNSLDDLGSASSFQMSDSGDLSDLGRATRLPDVGTSAGMAVSVDPNRDYPTTGPAFSLPDPAAAVAAARSDVASDTSNSFEVPPMSGNSRSNVDVASAGLANAIATADRQYTSDRRKEALATLSLFYETPSLTSEQREELLIRLDPLAREVIYSPEHLLEEPHRVGGSETLMDIAQKYDVPWQLLANINGVGDPVTVLPGTDLKVLRGPFRADVDLANQELTLFLGDLYAGRFPVGIGSDPVPRSGTYTIQEKNSAKTYYDMSGNPVPPGNARNPYGSMWIDLGSGISLHGSPKSEQPTDQGCISVAGNYSRDVFGILSEGSSVTIR